jgi:outer membrane protein
MARRFQAGRILRAQLCFQGNVAAVKGILKEFSSRMNRLMVLSLLLASGFSVAASAQVPAAPMPSDPASASAAQSAPVGPARIATVAFQLAVSQTNEFQRAFTDLQKKWDPKRQQLKARSDDMDKLTKDLQTEGDKLSEAERASRMKTLDDKKKKFDRDQGDDQNDFQQEMQELYANSASKVYDVLSNYAEKNGFTLVLDISGQQTPVLYRLDSTDITKPVIEAYNVKSGVPPLPGAPATTPATSTPKTPSAPRPAAPATPPGQ